MTYRPIKHHGIRLADGSFLHNAVFEPLAIDPTGAELVPGRYWHNTTENVNKFTTSDGAGGVTVHVSTTQAAVDAINTRVGTTGNLSTTVTTDLVTAINEVNTKAVAANIKIGTLANLTTTSKTDLVTALNEVKNNVSTLGNVFNYVTVISGGTEVAPFDLTTLSQKDTGDYYKVTTAGWFVVAPNAAIYANVGDGLVWNTTGNVDKIDNTDAVVSGTADEIAVTGTVDTGFTVAFSQTFRDSVIALEDVQSASVTALGLNPDGTLPSWGEANYIGLTTNHAAAIYELDLQAGFARRDITAISTAAGLDGNGHYVPFEYGNYIQSATTIHDATIKLDAALKTEVDRAKAVEGSVDDILAYYNATHNEFNALSSLSEAIIRTDYRLTTAVANVLSQVEATHTEINESYVTFKSTAAATSFEITHNFGTNKGAEFITVDVWVKDVNGGFTRYYNDIVSIEETTPDKVTITATSAIEIKAVVHAIVPLGLAG